MEFKNNDGCFWPTLRGLKLCIQSCILSESVHVSVHHRTQEAVPGFCAGYVLQA